MAAGRDTSAPSTAGRALGTTVVLAVALVGLTSGRAGADAVEPPPASCPRGSTPDSSHAGPICRPRAECVGDATCGAGERCLALSFCIEIRDCGGLRPADDVCTLEHVVAECAEGVTCEFGACVARSVCAAPLPEAPAVRETPEPAPAPAARSADTPPTSPTRCRAAAGARAPGPITLLASASLLLVAARRTRGRAP